MKNGDLLEPHAFGSTLLWSDLVEPHGPPSACVVCAYAHVEPHGPRMHAHVEPHRGGGGEEHNPSFTWVSIHQVLRACCAAIRLLRRRPEESAGCWRSNLSSCCGSRREPQQEPEAVPKGGVDSCRERREAMRFRAPAKVTVTVMRFPKLLHELSRHRREVMRFPKLLHT